MKRYGLVFFAAALLTLSSCTREMQESVRTGRFTISATADECTSKTTINGTVFKWVESDKIGLFLNQASMPVVNSPCSIINLHGDGKKADFTTDSDVSLDMTGKRYVSAYYPYKSSQNSTNLTFSIPRLQKQSDKDASHVGKYDYMATRQVELKGESVEMNFSHLMSKVDFQFINEHENPLTVKSVKIKTAEALFHTSVNYDISEAYPIAKAVESTAVEEIGVETEGEWTVVVPEEMLTVTMMMIPVDLSDKKVTVTVSTKEKGDFIFEKDGIDFLPENRYRVLLAIKEKTFIVEPSELDFGDTETEKSFFITSLNGMSEVNLSCSSSWLTLSESSINIQSDKTVEVKATIDRSLFVSGRKYRATINVTSGTTTRTVTAKASVSSENEAISPHEDLIITVDKCAVFNRIGTINFTIKNIGEVDHSLRIYTTWSTGRDDYAYAYDDRGNELCIDTVNGCSSMSSSSSITVPPGEEKSCNLTIQNVSNDAAIIKCADLKCNIDGGKDDDIFFNNISIEDRSPSPLPPAIEGIAMTCGDPDLKFEIYDIQQQYPRTIFYYRLTNTSDDLINTSWRSPAMCFDNAGNEYAVSMGSLGFVNSESYYTRIPSGVSCNGTFTVTGLPRTYPKLEWLSFRTGKQFIYNRQESTERYYSEMIIRDFEVEEGSETPEPAPVTAKAPGYLYHPDSKIEFTVVSSRIDGDNLKVDFRLKDNDECTKWFNISGSDCMAYAYDDRDNFYKLSGIKVGCEGTGAHIAPGVWCNGSFVLTGFDEKASKIKYLTFKTEYGDNYPSTEKRAFLIMKDLEVEERIASSDPLPQVETTADAVSSFDDDLKVSVVSCTASGSTVDFRFKIKNLSGNPKIIEPRTYNNYAFDDFGNSLEFSSILCGGYDAFAIPPDQECYVRVLIPNVKLEAGKLQIISIYSYSYDENHNNSKNGRFDFKGVRIQEREPATPPEPTTTASSAFCSNNSDIEVKVLSCSLISESKAKVSLMLHNKGSKSVNFNLYNSDVSNTNKWSNAYDYHGRRFKITEINLAGTGTTSVTLGSGCDCSLTFNLNSLVPETGMFQMVNVQGDIILRVTDLKIEGREDSPITWPEPSTTFGSITSPYSDFVFEGVSARIKDGYLYVKYLVTNNSNDFEEILVKNDYYSSSYSSYAIDNLGNYHRMDAGAGDYEKGYWYCNNYSSSGDLNLGFAPNYKGYGFFRIKNFDEKASSIKELSLQVGSGSSTRLVFKDIAIEGREPVAFPDSTTTCGEIVSCSDDLKFEMLGCKLFDGHLQVTMKVTNTSSSAKFIKGSEKATIVDSNEKSFSIGYGGICGNEYYYNSNYGTYIPSEIPVVMLFDGTGVYTEAATITKLEEKFDIYTGFNKDNHVTKTLTVNDIKIEGR